MKKMFKNILNFFNYEITTKDSWYKRQENYIAEISNEENEILKKIKEFSMCSIPNHWAILQSIKYIASNKIDGDFVEAGVFKGGNLILMNYLNNKLTLSKKIFAYDTFEGMPEENKDFDFDIKNKSATDTRKAYKKNEWCYASLNEVQNNLSKFDKNYQDNLVFVKGKVEQTLDNENNIPKKISLLRLDTDFYESTKKEMEVLYPRLQNKGVLIIDDYGHWKGSKKAVDDYFKNDLNFKFFHRIDYASRLYIKE